MTVFRGKRCSAVSDQGLECQLESGHRGDHYALRETGVVYEDDPECPLCGLQRSHSHPC